MFIIRNTQIDFRIAKINFPYANKLVFRQPYANACSPSLESALPAPGTARPANHVAGYLSDWKVYHFHDTSDTAKVKGSHSIHDCERLRPQGENIAAFLYNIRETSSYQKIVKTIQRVAPFFHDFVFQEEKNELIRLRWKHKGSDEYFDATMLPSEESYTLVVEANEEHLIQDIRQLKADLASIGWRTEGYVQGLRLGAHLYEPLLYSEKVAIQPVALNKSEFQFVNDLRQWLQAHEAGLLAQGKRLFLLRNLAKRGVGFFEAGNFFPDFILWCVMQDGKQRISFIDPHGLEHEGPGSDKVVFSENIKQLEQRLNDPEVTLESFILSPSTTPRGRIEHLWQASGAPKIDLDKLHVLFMSESDYLNKLLAIAAA